MPAENPIYVTFLSFQAIPISLARIIKVDFINAFALLDRPLPNIPARHYK